MTSRGNNKSPLEEDTSKSVETKRTTRGTSRRSSLKDADKDKPASTVQDNSSSAHLKKSRGKLFQCTGHAGCSMVFTRSEHLARHIRKHTGERPFQCGICMKKFSRLDNLRQHKQTVHHAQLQQSGNSTSKYNNKNIVTHSKFPPPHLQQYNIGPPGAMVTAGSSAIAASSSSAMNPNTMSMIPGTITNGYMDPLNPKTPSYEKHQESINSPHQRSNLYTLESPPNSVSPNIRTIQQNGSQSMLPPPRSTKLLSKNTAGYSEFRPSLSNKPVPIKIEPENRDDQMNGHKLVTPTTATSNVSMSIYGPPSSNIIDASPVSSQMLFRSFPNSASALSSPSFAVFDRSIGGNSTNSNSNISSYTMKFPNHNYPSSSANSNQVTPTNANFDFKNNPYLSPMYYHQGYRIPSNQHIPQHQQNPHHHLQQQQQQTQQQTQQHQQQQQPQFASLPAGIPMSYPIQQGYPGQIPTWHNQQHSQAQAQAPAQAPAQAQAHVQTHIQTMPPQTIRGTSYPSSAGPLQGSPNNELMQHLKPHYTMPTASYYQNSPPPPLQLQAHSQTLTQAEIPSASVSDFPTGVTTQLRSTSYPNHQTDTKSMGTSIPVATSTTSTDTPTGSVISSRSHDASLYTLHGEQKAGPATVPVPVPAPAPAPAPAAAPEAGDQAGPAPSVDDRSRRSNLASLLNE